MTAWPSPRIPPAPRPPPTGIRSPTWARSRRPELVIERGEGVHVFDAEGRATSTRRRASGTQRRPRPRRTSPRAVAAQLGPAGRLLDVRRLLQPARPTLAERLAALAPMRRRQGLPRLRRRRRDRHGGQDRPSPLGAAGAPERVHSSAAPTATTARTRSAPRSAGSRPTRPNWGPLIPHTSAVAFDSLPALEQEFLRVGPERVAAFFCEPVIGAGGVHAPPEGYIEGVADLCEEYGILLVIDCGDLRLRAARDLVRDRALA